MEVLFGTEKQVDYEDGAMVAICKGCVRDERGLQALSTKGC
jgi:hypothetical protein